MIPYEMFKAMDTVDEDWIKHKVDHTKCEENYKLLLVYGQMFKKAGLSPIYLATPDGTKFTVSSKETCDARKLH